MNILNGIERVTEPSKRQLERAAAREDRIAEVKTDIGDYMKDHPLLGLAMCAASDCMLFLLTATAIILFCAFLVGFQPILSGMLRWLLTGSTTGSLPGIPSIL